MLSTNPHEVIRRPTVEDLEFIIANIREEDRQEVADFDGDTIADVLEPTPDMFEHSWVWEYKGQVHAVFGVNPIEGHEGVGVIWMLATKFINEHLSAFISSSRLAVNMVVKNYKYVYNYVSVKNKKSIRWLKWVGFDMRDAEPIGVNGAMFNRFEMWNKKCAIQ